MADTLRKRLENLELRFQPVRITRDILAARPRHCEPYETHDTIRAILGLQPEPGVIDLVVFSLPPGSPPRLQFPHEWEHMRRQVTE